MNGTREDDPFAVAEEDTSAAASGFRRAIAVLEEHRRKLAEAERAAEEAKDEIERMLTGTLANMMHELGLESATLSTGERLKLQPFATCTIKKGREDDAYSWLRNHGHGGLVRETLTLSVPESRANEAGDVFAKFIEAGWEVSSKKGIHAATLKSWAGEMFEKGEEIPEDYFKASTINRANIRKR